MTFLSPNDPRFQADSDAVSIQNAINAAEKGDIRTVCIPCVCARTGKPEWIIDKSILLPSNITILLDDCHLILKAGVYENIFRNKNLYTDIDIKPEGKQTGIRIIGMGDAILDGGEGNFAPASLPISPVPQSGCGFLSFGGELERGLYMVSVTIAPNCHEQYQKYSEQ